MSDCPQSSQSGTGMNKKSDAGTSRVPEQGDPIRYRNAPVPDWDTGCRNADAGGLDLDLDDSKKSRYAAYGKYHLGRGYAAENPDEFVELLQVAEVQPAHHSTDKWTILNEEGSFNIIKNKRISKSSMMVRKKNFSKI